MGGAGARGGKGREARAGREAARALLVWKTESSTREAPGPLAISATAVSERHLPPTVRCVRAVRALNSALKVLALISCGRGR